MKDLTQGPVSRQVLAMAAPIAIGMILQTLYFLIDLYVVGRLGDDAIAGVSTAGNVTFVVMALTQVLAVGTVALVSHAVGRRDLPEPTWSSTRASPWQRSWGRRRSSVAA